MSGTTIVYLKRGQTVDLTGRSPDEAIALLQRLGVKPEDIERTVHRVDRQLAAVLERIRVVVPPRLERGGRDDDA